MARTKRIGKIQEEIARLQAELEKEREARTGHLGELAVKAGLADVDVNDRELLAALKEVAGRFQGSTG